MTDVLTFFLQRFLDNPFFWIGIIISSIISTVFLVIYLVSHHKAALGVAVTLMIANILMILFDAIFYSMQVNPVRMLP